MRWKYLRALTALIAIVTLGGAGIAAAPIAMPDRIPATIVAPRGAMPAMLHHTSALGRYSYHAALESPELLEQVPCTCGCEPLGHRNNRDCYIEGVHNDGSIEFTTHGLYCEVCQLITRDALAAFEQGMSAGDVRAMILDRYGR